MLDHKTGSMVIISELLRRNGYALEPEASTPMMKLTGLTFSIAQQASVKSPTPTDFHLLSKEFITNTSVVNPAIHTISDHDLSMENAATAMASIIRANIQVVRGTIKPMILSIVKSVEEKLSSTGNVAITTPVVEDSVHEIYEDRMIQEIVKAGENIYTDLPSAAFFSIIDLPEIMGLMKTGMTQTDALVESLINSVGGDRLLQLYGAFFVANVNGDHIATAKSRDDYLCLLLISRGLSTRIPDLANGTRSSVESIEIRLEQLTEQLKLRIETSLIRYEQAIQSDILVVSYPEEIAIDSQLVAEPILVNSTVYRQWLEEGGVVEILYGAMMTDRKVGAVDLFAGREDYLKACDKYLNTIQQRNESSRDAVIKYTIADSAIAYINQLEEIPACDMDKATLTEAIRRQAGRIYLTSIEGLYEAVKALVCRTIFTKGHAEEIIDHMIKNEAESEELSTEEMLSNSVLDLLAKWVIVGQTTIKKQV